MFQAHVDSCSVSLLLCGFPGGVLGPAIVQAFTSSEACIKLLILWLRGSHLSHHPLVEKSMDFDVHIYIRKSWLCSEHNLSVFSVLVKGTVCSCTCNWGSFIRQCWVFYVWSNLSWTLLFIMSLYSKVDSGSFAGQKSQGWSHPFFHT